VFLLLSNRKGKGHKVLNILVWKLDSLKANVKHRSVFQFEYKRARAMGACMNQGNNFMSQMRHEGGSGIHDCPLISRKFKICIESGNSKLRICLRFRIGLIENSYGYSETSFGVWDSENLIIFVYEQDALDLIVLK